MSRCFPFPPRGYEKRPTDEDVDLLKKEKRKEKKHKKDKKDKERRDRDGKRKEKKEKHRDKKSGNDKEKGKQVEGQNGDKILRNDEQKAELSGVKKPPLRPGNERDPPDEEITRSSLQFRGEFPFRDPRRHTKNRDPAASRDDLGPNSPPGGGGGPKKRKDTETNGFSHENETRPKKTARPTPDASTENGRKLLDGPRPGPGGFKPDSRERRVNGVTASGPTSKKPSVPASNHVPGRPVSTKSPPFAANRASSPPWPVSATKPSSTVPNQPVSSTKPSSSAPGRPVSSTKPSSIDPNRPASTKPQPVSSTKPLSTVPTQPVSSTKTSSTFPNQPVSSTKPVSTVPSQPVSLTKPVSTVHSQPVSSTKPVSTVPSQPVSLTKPSCTFPSEPVSSTKPVSTVPSQPVSSTKPLSTVPNQILAGSWPVSPPKPPSFAAQPPPNSKKKPLEASKRPRPPHPDTKRLSKILTVPEPEPWLGSDDGQDWLFGETGRARLKETAAGRGGGDGDAGFQVWSEAKHLESVDVWALPYVIPY